jgi:hypothetical protein
MRRAPALSGMGAPVAADVLSGTGAGVCWTLAQPAARVRARPAALDRKVNMIVMMFP